MTRLIGFLVVAVFLVGVCAAQQRSGTESSRLLAVGVSVTTAASGTARVAVPLSTVPKSHRGRHPRCTDQHWKRTLHPIERWIDRRESGLNPDSREPSTGAYGIGQLLPETYRTLGLAPSASPCRQIAAQRAYMRRRVWPITRSSGDIDKHARQILDALTDITYVDDSQVVELHIEKHYVDAPLIGSVHIDVRRLP